MQDINSWDQGELSSGVGYVDYVSNGTPSWNSFARSTSQGVFASSEK